MRWDFFLETINKRTKSSRNYLVIRNEKNNVSNNQSFFSEDSESPDSPSNLIALFIF